MKSILSNPEIYWRSRQVFNDVNVTAWADYEEIDGPSIGHLERYLTIIYGHPVKVETGTTYNSRIVEYTARGQCFQFMSLW